jgi:hypothetical protein
MLIELTDFPSDPNGETRQLRKELLTALRKADSYPRSAKRLREILTFASKKLTEVNKAQSIKTKE